MQPLPRLRKNGEGAGGTNIPLLSHPVLNLPLTPPFDEIQWKSGVMDASMGTEPGRQGHVEVAGDWRITISGRWQRAADTGHLSSGL